MVGTRVQVYFDADAYREIVRRADASGTTEPKIVNEIVTKHLEATKNGVGSSLPNGSSGGPSADSSKSSGLVDGADTMKTDSSKNTPNTPKQSGRFLPSEGSRLRLSRGKS